MKTAKRIKRADEDDYKRKCPYCGGATTVHKVEYGTNGADTPIVRIELQCVKCGKRHTQIVEAD